MDISQIMTAPPTPKELASRTNAEKIWDEFSFFYESGIPHYFELENGTKVAFADAPGEAAWNLIINYSIVLTSGDAEEIVSKVLVYLEQRASN